MEIQIKPSVVEVVITASAEEFKVLHKAVRLYRSEHIDEFEEDEEMGEAEKQNMFEDATCEKFCNSLDVFKVASQRKMKSN